MFKRNLKLLLFIIPFLVVGGYFLVMGLQETKGDLSDVVSISLDSLYLKLGIGFLVGPILIVFLIIIFSGNRQKKAERLLKDGLRGKARVLEVSDTGVFVNNQPRLKVKLEVDLRDRSPFTVVKKMVIPHSRLSQIQVDTTIEVAADPADPTNPKNIALLLK